MSRQGSRPTESGLLAGHGILVGFGCDGCFDADNAADKPKEVDMHRILALFCLVSLAVAAVPPEAVAAADAWVERAIARGLPDARGAVPFAGMLRVTVSIPVDDMRPLWEEWWPLELVSVDQSPARFMRLRLDGAHFRLPDGSWLAGGERLVRPGDGVDVDTSGLRPITLAAAVEIMPAWQMASSAGSMHQYDARELHLWRLDAQGREQRLLGRYIVSPWQPLLQPRSLVTGDDVPARWGTFFLDPDLGAQPAALLPRLLRDHAFIWFANRTCDGTALPRQEAATAALEFAPADVHEALAHYFTAVAAAAAVPPWRPGGSLIDLLRSWDNGPPPDPALLDLDALAAALDDRRPSAWIESSIPRLVGDNALRAMAWKLGRDPRLLAGLDPTEPWQDETRSRAAKEVQAWWSMNRGTPIPQLLATSLSRSSLGVQVQMVARLPEDQRPAVLAGIAASWVAHDPFVDPPPAPPQSFMIAGPGPAQLARGKRQQVDQLLAMAGKHTAILDALDRLPERPTTRLPRALAHDLRNDPLPLDALLSAVLAGAGDWFEARDVLAAVQHRPTPARLAVLRAALAAKAPRWRLMIGILVLGSTQHAAAQLHADRFDARAGLALRLGLAIAALDDHTTVDEWIEAGAPVYSKWRCDSDDGHSYVPFTGGLPGAPQVQALSAEGGLRLCDIVAYALYEPARFIPELAPAGCDTAASIPDRNAAITAFLPRVIAVSTQEWKRLLGDGP